MEFPPEHYFQTATQRMRQAHLLFEDGSSYSLAIYIGGVAVECLLRAFKGRRDPTFDERHNLLLLYKASGMWLVDSDRLLALKWSPRQLDEYSLLLEGAMNDVYKMWANNYRFASEQRLKSHLKKMTGYKKIKGDYLKEQSRRFLNAAQTVFDKGMVLWHT